MKIFEPTTDPICKVTGEFHNPSSIGLQKPICLACFKMLDFMSPVPTFLDRIKGIVRGKDA